MRLTKKSVLAGLAAIVLTAAGAAALAQQPSPAPLAYTADGKMLMPKDYRTWVYLSTSFDLS